MKRRCRSARRGYDGKEGEHDDDDEEEEGEEGVMAKGVTRKKKRNRKRDICWTTKEEECLVESWKAVTGSPITGTNQTSTAQLVQNQDRVQRVSVHRTTTRCT